MSQIFPAQAASDATECADECDQNQGMLPRPEHMHRKAYIQIALLLHYAMVSVFYITSDLAV